MSGREHRADWDISDAEWADRRDDPMVTHLEHEINDLAAALLEPELAPDAKRSIRVQASALQAMCVLLEKSR